MTPEQELFEADAKRVVDLLVQADVALRAALKTLNVLAAHCPAGVADRKLQEVVDATNRASDSTAAASFNAQFKLSWITTAVRNLEAVRKAAK